MRIFTLLFMGSTALIACHKGENVMAETKEKTVYEQVQADISGNANQMAESPQTKEIVSVNPKMGQMLIKNANIKLRVTDLEMFGLRIDSLMLAYQGYATASASNDENDRISRQLTVQVKADNFGKFLEQVQQDADKVYYVQVNADDVSEEFVDLNARMETKKQVEQRFRDILKNAHKVSDILEVENQLRIIREEIESVQARLNFLSQRSAYSTIQIEVYQWKKDIPVSEKEGFFAELLTSVGAGMTGLKKVFFALISVWPLWLIAGVAFIYWRRRLKRKESTKQKA